MHGMAGLLEQMDHEVDPLAKDEENQQNKSLKRESCVQDNGKGVSPEQPLRQWLR